MKEPSESLSEALTHCNICTEFNIISPLNNNQTPKTICWDQLTTSEHMIPADFFSFLTSPTWFFMDHCVKHTPLHKSQIQNI